MDLTKHVTLELQKSARLKLTLHHPSPLMCLLICTVFLLWPSLPLHTQKYTNINTHARIHKHTHRHQKARGIKCKGLVLAQWGSPRVYPCVCVCVFTGMWPSASATVSILSILFYNCNMLMFSWQADRSFQHSLSLPFAHVHTHTHKWASFYLLLCHVISRIFLHMLIKWDN